MKVKALTAVAVAAALAGGNAYASGKAGGIKFDDGKKDFTFKLGGRIMWDYDYYDGAYNIVAGQDRGAAQANLRRARLELKGKVYQDWGYNFTYNINNSSVNDAAIHYLGFKGHKLSIGQMKEPFGLEELTSSKWISTAERSMFWDSTNADSHNFGFLYHGWSGPFTWSGGLFRTGRNGQTNVDGDDVNSFTGRFTFAPVVGKSNVLHFGVAASKRSSGDSGAAAEELINASGGVSGVGGNNTLVVQEGAGGELYDGETLLGLEILWIGGPFSAQFEYFNRDLDVTTAGLSDQSTSAWYLQGTWTLTGESRGYKRKTAYADKIKPKGKGGAWELVAKIDNIEADCGSTAQCTAAGAAGQDPEVQAVTLGVNWYANPAVKMTLNYTSTTSDNIVAAGAEEDASAILLRTQLAF